MKNISVILVFYELVFKLGFLRDFWRFVTTHFNFFHNS